MQMQMAKLVPGKTLTERLVHALTFEVTAIVICAPIVSWVLGLSLVHVGALTAAVSVIAIDRKSVV